MSNNYKATRKKYADNPINKKIRTDQHRKRIFKKYGMSSSSFEEMLERQNFRCLGCKKSLLENPIRMDHNHATQQMRGLLCNSCNVALGMVKDDPSILHNLSAYISRDASKHYVYLIGSLRNQKLVEVGNALREIGLCVFDQWVGAGPEADDYWQAYSKAKGLSYKEALADVGARHVFHFDRSHLELSDTAVLVMPAGKSGHLELGYMAGLGKKCYILAEGEPERYDVMSQFANDIYFNTQDLIERLKDG